MKLAIARAARRPNLNRQRGYSMVEIGLGLVIATLITVGVVTHFSNNSTTAQANQFGSDLSLLIGKVKGAYSGQYSQVTNARLDTGGFFAKYPSMTNNAGVVTTGLGGGTLTVSSGTVTTANDSVKYVITQVPDDACLPLVMALAKTATTLKVGAKDVKKAGSLPDPSQITCAGDNTEISIQVQ